MPRIFWMWTTSSPLNLKFWHRWTLNFPTRQKFIVLPSHHNTQRPPLSLNEWRPPSLDEWPASSLSRAGILPLSRWHPPSRAGILPLALASSLSHWHAPSRAGMLPLLCWHPPSLDERLPFILFWWTASFHIWQWPCPSLGWWASLPRRTASPLLWQAASPLPRQTVPSLGGWPHPSLHKLSPPSLSEQPPPCLDGHIPQQMLSSHVSGGLAMSKYYCHS